MELPDQDPASLKNIELIRYYAHQRHSLRNMTFLRPGFCCVLRGTKIMDLPQGKSTVGTSSLIFYAPHERIPMQHIPDISGYESVVVSFSASLLNEFNSRHRDLLENTRPITTTTPLVLTADIHDAWQRLIKAQSRDEPAVMVKYLFEGVLLRLALAGYSITHATRDTSLSQLISAQVAQSPATALTLADVATTLFISESTLNRRLKAEGKHFRQLQEDVRLSIAMNYVQTSTLPVGRIAELIGYASVSRFIARFKSRFGLTPGALRKMILPEPPEV